MRGLTNQNKVVAMLLISDQSPRWDARVLVAEDSDVNQFIIKELLAVFGLSPVVVGNGKEAVASFRTGSL